MFIVFLSLHHVIKKVSVEFSLAQCKQKQIFYFGGKRMDIRLSASGIGVARELHLTGSQISQAKNQDDFKKILKEQGLPLSSFAIELAKVRGFEIPDEYKGRNISCRT